MLDLGWLAVFVGAKEADIEIEARILEVIRVAAVEGGLLLGREDQAHIGILLEAVKVILAALVERDDIAAQACLVERFLLQFRHHAATGEEGFLVGHAGFDGGVDALGHVLDAHENVEFQIVAALFLRPRTSVEAIAVVVML